MNPPRIRIARSVLVDLENIVSHGQPALSTERGDLFVCDSLPLAAVRLKIRLHDYLTFLASLSQSDQPAPFRVAPVDDVPFEVVIRGMVEVRKNNTVLIDGKQATVL
jgi:hypothetical protein